MENLDRIQSAAIIGAGAIGSFFIEGLENQLPGRLYVIAEGERKSRLEKEGIIVNEKQLTLNVRSPEEAKGVDLIIVCVKYGALEEAVRMIRQMVGPHTIILSPMNGVDSEEILAASIGKEHILHSMMVIAAQREGSRIFYNTGVLPCLHYGKAENFGSIKDLSKLSDLFENAHLNVKCHDNIISMIWNKFALNISTNIAQAIIGCNYGSYKTSSHMNALGQHLCDEVLAVAKAKGIECTFDNQRALRTIGTNDSAIFSTLQDLKAHRHTEVDMFCKAMMRMGKECGISVPFNEFAFHAIKAIEEKNDGLIS